jgi:Tfp pilus assembly protein PilX
MSPRYRIAIACKRAARALLERQDGIALPTAIMMLMVVSTLGTLAVKQAVSTEGQSVVDRSVKRAIDAADAGYDTAIYRINKMQPKTAECVIVGGSGQLVNNSNSADAQGWCPAQTEDLGDGATYSYRMSTATNMSQNGQTLLQRKIVSTGTVTFAGSRTATRRTLSLVAANTGNPLVGNYAMISSDPNFDIDLKDTARINGDMGSNANIDLNNQTDVCGDIYYGIGKKFTTQNQGANNDPVTCLPPNSGYNNAGGNQGHVAPQPFVLGPVEQGTANQFSNPPCVTPCNDNGSLSSSVYDSTTRTLHLSNQSVTLTGNIYSFCHIELQNTSTIYIAPRIPSSAGMRIYLDSPENCPGVPDAGNFWIRNSSQITNLNSDPATLTLFVVGSPNIPTTVAFSQTSNSQVAMVVYAPYSTCTLENSASIRGAVACKRVYMRNTAQITWDPLVGALTNTQIIPLYRRYSYVECDKISSPSPPNTGCS